MTCETTTETTLRRRLRALAAPLRRLTLEKAGTSMFLAAFAMPVVLAMAGLGLDVTMWYLDRRENQTLADNIALAATIELSRDSNVTDAILENVALEEAKRAGFTEDGTTLDIAVNRPPIIGPNAGDDQFVEVVVSEQRNLFLAGFVMDGPVTVEGRSVGSIVASGNHCIVALEESEPQAIAVTGTADVDISCGMASNSSDEQSIYVDGKANLTADPVQAFGDIEVTSNATLTTTTPPQALSERVEDPYLATATAVMPTLSNSCKATAPPFDIKTDAKSGSGTSGDPYILEPNWDPVTLAGDVKKYCGGISATGKIFVEFEPGVYVVDDGDISFGAQTTITVNNALAPFGVTFILTAYEPGKKTTYTGNFLINAGADVTLMAPTQGPTAGLLVIQDPDAVSSYGDGTSCEPNTGLQCNAFEGGADMELTGVIYVPTREVRYAGNNASGSQCTQIVALKVTLAGTANIANDPAACTAAGVQNVAQTRVRLIE